MCASVERKNLIASLFTSPLKTPLGWGRRRNAHIERCFLKSVCSYLGVVVLNLPPLNRFRSRNSTHSSLMLHVNFSILCALLSLSKKTF